MHLKRANRQLGFSLVELMVALLLGAILTSGVISVFVTSKTTYNVNNALGQVQEAGRFALTTLQPLLVRAGFTGCENPSADNMNTYWTSIAGGDTDPVYMAQYGVMGYEYTNTGPNKTFTDTTGKPVLAAAASEWSPIVSTELFNILKANKAVKYSDILIVHEASPNPAPIIDNSPAATLTYTVANAPAMAAGDLAVASNCLKQVAFFQITALGGGTITHTIPGGANPGNVTSIANYNPGAVAWPTSLGTTLGAQGNGVSRENTYVFFVGEDTQVSTDYGLFEITMPSGSGLLGTPVEIVPGVENMQLLYGIDTDGDQVPNLFTTADLISIGTVGGNTSGLTSTGTPDGNWNEVVSVRVSLIVHSDDNAIESTYKNNAGTTLNNAVSQKFYMLGTGATDSLTYNSYADRRLRRYFSETFSVRVQNP